jgi:hypothetical protein
LGKNPRGFKSREAFDGGTVAVVGFGFLAVDARGEDRNAFRAFDDVAAEFAPSVSTIIYLHFSERHLKAAGTPLDKLKLSGPENVKFSRKLHKK